jgi:hypothetical protein
MRVLLILFSVLLLGLPAVAAVDVVVSQSEQEVQQFVRTKEYVDWCVSSGVDQNSPVAVKKFCLAKQAVVDAATELSDTPTGQQITDAIAAGGVVYWVETRVSAGTFSDCTTATTQFCPLTGEANKSAEVIARGCALTCGPDDKANVFAAILEP